MGIYSTYIFPRIMSLGMSTEILSHYREKILKNAQGEILEIGFGTGLNLPYYPTSVRKIHAIDANKGMIKPAQKTIIKSPIEVDFHIVSAERLPFPNNFFDTVVSTWTLCSIQNVGRALLEVYRVLKPQGKFLFVEHGLSNEPTIQKWQHRITPIQKIVADGCHLNRNMEQLVRETGFKMEAIHKEYADGTPKIAGYFYYGVATK